MHAWPVQRRLGGGGYGLSDRSGDLVWRLAAPCDCRGARRAFSGCHGTVDLVEEVGKPGLQGSARCLMS